MKSNAASILSTLVEAEPGARMSREWDKFDKKATAANPNGNINAYRKPPADTPQQELIAVTFGTMDGQIKNGGVLQWIDNRYADSHIDQLKDFVSQYKADFPVMAKVENWLSQLDDLMENGRGNRGFRSLEDMASSQGKEAQEEELRELLDAEDFESIDSLLGGTDLDRRKFNQWMWDSLDEKLSYEEKEVEGGQFVGQLKFASNFDRHGKGTVLLQTVPYATDEEAADALLAALPPKEEPGNSYRRTSRSVAEWLSMVEEVATNGEDATVVSQARWNADADELEGDVKESCIDSIIGSGEYVNDSDVFEQMDTQYDEFEQEMLQALEQIFERDYPEGTWAKFQQAVGKAAQAVGTAVKSAVKAVKNAPRIARKAVGQGLTSLGQRLAAEAIETIRPQYGQKPVSPLQRANVRGRLHKFLPRKPKVQRTPANELTGRVRFNPMLSHAGRAFASESKALAVLNAMFRQ